VLPGVEVARTRWASRVSSHTPGLRLPAAPSLWGGARCNEEGRPLRMVRGRPS